MIPGDYGDEFRQGLSRREAALVAYTLGLSCQALEEAPRLSMAFQRSREALLRKIMVHSEELLADWGPTYLRLRADTISYAQEKEFLRMGLSRRERALVASALGLACQALAEAPRLSMAFHRNREAILRDLMERTEELFDDWRPIYLPHGVQS